MCGQVFVAFLCRSARQVFYHVNPPLHAAGGAPFLGIVPVLPRAFLTRYKEHRTDTDPLMTAFSALLLCPKFEFEAGTATVPRCCEIDPTAPLPMGLFTSASLASLLPKARLHGPPVPSKFPRLARTFRFLSLTTRRCRARGTAGRQNQTASSSLPNPATIRHLTQTIKSSNFH
uniref:Uncharacterized protein n=1 Tax=Branchiostoma floridae TaxID=7739 RepID=C3YZ11_BRAFL|eukprot:XP_002598507.1 hypothetical protein BRAFLDRAFT_66884 [Branchiostoma floridae]